MVFALSRTFHRRCGASSLNSLVKPKPTLWLFPLSGGSCYHIAHLSLYARGCPAWLAFPMCRQPWMPGATLEFCIPHSLSPIFTDIVCFTQLLQCYLLNFTSWVMFQWVSQAPEKVFRRVIGIGTCICYQGLRYHVLQDVCSIRSPVAAFLLLGFTWQYGLQDLSMYSLPWPDWSASTYPVSHCGKPELLLLCYKNVMLAWKLKESALQHL